MKIDSKKAGREAFHYVRYNFRNIENYYSRKIFLQHKVILTNLNTPFVGICSYILEQFLNQKSTFSAVSSERYEVEKTYERKHQILVEILVNRI